MRVNIVEEFTNKSCEGNHIICTVSNGGIGIIKWVEKGEKQTAKLPTGVYKLTVMAATNLKFTAEALPGWEVKCAPADFKSISKKLKEITFQFRRIV